MKSIIPNMCLVLYVLTKVSGKEVTDNINPLTTSNDAKSRDTGAENQKYDLKDTTKDHTTKASTTSTPQSKFDMNDFKVTKLKSNHNEEDNEDCLATANPEKVEAVRKTLKNDGGRVDFVASEALLVNDEEIKIAACLKNEKPKTTKITTVKGDNNTATKTPLETVEEVEMELEDQVKKGRRDTEYQFDPLEYYDETVTFDPSACPDDVDVINLQIAELRQYDLECELLTHWVGLAETVINM